MTLTTDPKQWRECIEASGKSCLSSALSAKNVKEVLSRAVTRGPQKNLCHDILPFVPDMVKNSSGVSILTALVLYGTPATVEHVAKEVVKTDRQLWSFTDITRCGDLVDEISALLDGFIYRTDATGENTWEIRQNFKGKKEWIFKQAVTLPAAGRLLANDADFLKAASKSKMYQSAFAEASTEKGLKAAAAKFCENSLSGGPGDNDLSTISDFLFQSIALKLSKGSTEKPHESILLAVSSKGSDEVVGKLGDLMSKWPSLHELAQREGYTRILSDILDRGNEKVGVKLIQGLFKSADEIDQRVRSRKSHSLRLLSVIAKKEVYVKTVNQTLGGDQSMKFRSAAAQYAKISGARGVVVRNVVQEKLKLLAEGKGKRPREQ